MRDAQSMQKQKMLGIRSRKGEKGANVFFQKHKHAKAFKFFENAIVDFRLPLWTSLNERYYLNQILFHLNKDLKEN